VPETGSKPAAASRAERERVAYDEQGVFEASNAWHVRFRHVFESPNTLRNERLFEQRLRARVGGARVLDIGCGDGESSERLLGLGAACVRGIDVAETFIERAKLREQPGRLEFASQDVGQPLAGRFDVIFGRAILHHLDWREVLARLHADNLAPGGMMIFMEPLGGNLLTRLFHGLARKAHTLDERPFESDDLRWLRRSFESLEILPINYVSFPAGLVSSYLFRRADNAMMRLCDRVDTWLARHAAFLMPRFRQAIFVIGK